MKIDFDMITNMTIKERKENEIKEYQKSMKELMSGLSDITHSAIDRFGNPDIGNIELGEILGLSGAQVILLKGLIGYVKKDG